MMNSDIIERLDRLQAQLGSMSADLRTTELPRHDPRLNVEFLSEKIGETSEELADMSDTLNSIIQDLDLQQSEDFIPSRAKLTEYEAERQVWEEEQGTPAVEYSRKDRS